MKFNFNETNIITGYIKELLRDFNLPVYTVYREDRFYYPTELKKRYIGKKLHKNKLYVYNDKIAIYDGNGYEPKPVCDYIYGSKYANATKNLIINSSIYDAYTHTYLGDYLRFLRDYKYINLMPLYNCFNTERPVGLNYSVNINTGDNNYIYNVDTSDQNYNYYIIPAKFDEKYTINIKASVPYELSCIIYTGDKVLDISKDLSRITYKRVNIIDKSYSYIYSTEVDESKFSVTGEDGYAANYWKYEENLRILLKLPKSVNSAITVLEGDYINYNHSCGKSLIGKLYLDDNTKIIDSISRLSLLDNNSNVSYPFADRLVEYLIGNTIDGLETIPDNVANIQTLLTKNLYFKNKQSEPVLLKFKGYYDTWDDNFIKVNIIRKLSSVIESTNVTKSYYKVYNYNNELMEYIPSTEDYNYLRPIDEYYDLLGYVDKNTEQNLNVKTIVNTTSIEEV